MVGMCLPKMVDACRREFVVSNVRFSSQTYGVAISKKIRLKACCGIEFRYGDLKLLRTGVKHVSNPPNHNIRDISIVGKVNNLIYTCFLNEDICTELMALPVI